MLSLSSSTHLIRLEYICKKWSNLKKLQSQKAARSMWNMLLVFFLFSCSFSFIFHKISVFFTFELISFSTFQPIQVFFSKFKIFLWSFYKNFTFRMVVICGQHSWAVAAVKRMNLSHVIGNAQTLILTESAVGQVFIETVIMISQIVQDHTVESVKCFFTKWTVQNLHDVFYLTFRNKMLTFQELIADWKKQ